MVFSVLVCFGLKKIKTILFLEYELFIHKFVVLKDYNHF
ncbi:hypothetical protein RCH33_445 [Flavobacterium daejeonense]|nr:hypothetical protein RCH33_445 [Flavobacterium daejeonense]